MKASDIKLRMWDIESCQFYYYNLLQIINGGIIEDYNDDHSYFDMFTGQKDKDGVDIYAGDVISTDSGKKFVIELNSRLSQFEMISYDPVTCSSEINAWPVHQRLVVDGLLVIGSGSEELRDGAYSVDKEERRGLKDGIDNAAGVQDREHRG